MADVTERQTVRSADDSTQRGCTTWLLLSCIVLTLTTAFVFGWGLGAPNMYNQYTEPFLKGSDPCLVDAAARARALDQPAAAVAPQAVINDGAAAQDTNGDVNDDYVRVELDAEGNEIDEIENVPAGTSPLQEPFNFALELIKGIPQTVFLIGAFLGAITGPIWSNLFDRKRTVFANYIFCFGSSLCILLAYYFRQPWLFYLSRFLLGYQGKTNVLFLPEK